MFRFLSHWFIHSFIPLGVPLRSSPTKNRKGHRPGCPMQPEGLHTMGCGLVQEGDRFQTAITAPLLYSLRHNSFHLDLGAPLPHLPVCVVVIWGITSHLLGNDTRWRTEGEVKGKLANGVGSQYSSHYLGTRCIQQYYRWSAHLGCQ